ncbi:protein of unknown function DUF847 [Solidesulfovibrio carbinoliphilus subsp. oakridgensis]|uniref:Uncharacterized protein n=1 Tax=Solidesulfovibrio carbinoliphilus subsp. oakridgensis TaxID=694327 RepID=G7QC83_9BACT|nr:glycosyl hydrolase 108 family protein [Solidesulfovibrio carbinoliphilus]EHJ49529.1 protein of unknown function DUF847 [Solidesulfovibrio carbinoliphilus subsp. oakridgensis]
MGFTEADKFRTKWEGGLSDNKADPGGVTKYGVSFQFLRAQGHDVDGDGDIDADDIRALTPAAASALLKQEFWTCQDLDSFPALTGIAHYDASVNCGRGRAVLLLQAACNAFDGQKIDEDGKLGPKTRARVAALDDELLALRCVQEREAFYKRLIAAKPALAVFADGWANRTADLIKYVQEVANVQAPAVLAPAPTEPPAPRMPTGGLSDVPGDGTTMGDAVEPGLPDVSRLTVVLKALAKSKTIYGVLGMLGLQLLGANAWDVALRIGGQIYTVPDLSPLISTALASLAVWGRVTARPIGGRNA